jgi:Glyoxalase-like domain
MSQTAQIDRQLPVGDEIFLDHVGHFVRDQAAAAAALERAGFTPTPVSVQVAPDGGPTGTGNVCAMMTRGYLEVLFKTADTPLGREFEAALGRHSGIQLAAFAVADANAWHRRLGEAGFRTRPIAPFSRPVGTETGTATAAFTVTRVEPGEMAEGRIQMLTHHTEDAVWQPRWLRHPNGARGLANLVIVVADVAEAAARYARFTQRPAAPTRAGQAVTLDRGRIDLVTRGAFAAALPEIAIPTLPFIGAYGVTVRSLDATEAGLRSSGLSSRRAGDMLVAPFPEELGKGAWLFSENSQASVLR